MNAYLDGEICPVCGKHFFVQDRKTYAYKISRAIYNNHSKVTYLCSYGCKNKMMEDLENEKNDRKRG